MLKILEKDEMIDFGEFGVIAVFGLAGKQSRHYS